MQQIEARLLFSGGIAEDCHLNLRQCFRKLPRHNGAYGIIFHHAMHVWKQLKVR